MGKEVEIVFDRDRDRYISNKQSEAAATKPASDLLRKSPGRHARLKTIPHRAANADKLAFGERPAEAGVSGFYAAEGL